MCISLGASIFAGVVGEVCSLILLLVGEIQIAALTSTASLIQFYEALGYVTGKTPSLVPIGVLLASQGVAFWAATHFLPSPSKHSSVVTLLGFLVSICILLLVAALQEPYETICHKGCKWRIGEWSHRALIAMYVTIFLYSINEPHLCRFARMSLGTLAGSIGLSMVVSDPSRAPSSWCLVAAATLPLYLATGGSRVDAKTN